MPTLRLRAAVPLWLASLAGTAGCTAVGLWDDADPELVREESISNGVVELHEGPAPETLLAIAERTGGAALPAVSGGATPRSGWYLQATDRAEVAVALLHDARFGVGQVDLQIRRELRDGEIRSSSASLCLSGTVSLREFVTEAGDAELSPAERAALRPAPANDFVSNRAADLPPLLAECVERLVHLDLAPCVPGAKVVRLVGFGFPAPAGPSPALPTPGPRPPFRELRPRLAELPVLLELEADGRLRTFRLSGDALWLWSELRAVHGTWRHESRWLVTPCAPTSVPPAPTLACGTARVHWTEERIDERGLLAGRILLTPIALAIDAAAWGTCLGCLDKLCPGLTDHHVTQDGGAPRERRR